MEVSQHSKYFCEFCGKVKLFKSGYLWVWIPSLFASNCMLLALIIFCTSSVCCEEKGCGNLGLQGLWESQSRRCLHFEVKTLVHLFFNITFLFSFLILVTNLLLLLLCDSTASAVTVRSTIRRLREQTESWAAIIDYSTIFRLSVLLS